MKNSIKILLLLAVTIFGVSCSDEDLGLDQKNPNSPSTDNYWTTLDRVETTIAASYSGLLNHWLTGYHMEAVRSDEAFPVNRTVTTGNYFTYYNQTVDNTSTDLNNKYESYYLVIFRANQVIEALENLENGQGVDMDRWNDQMAEARFLRGLMHFYLHSIFNNGEIVVRNIVPKTVDEINKGLSTSDEVITFFREDLQYAYDNLPASRPEGAYRASASAAGHALGTSYLYEGEYGTAITIFEDLVGNAAYGLELEDPFVLFTEEGENGKETIFEINYTLDVQSNELWWDETSFNNRWGRFTSPTGGGVQRFAPSAWLTHAYANEPMNMQDTRNYVNGHPRPVSLRSSAMVALVQDTVTTYYSQEWLPEVPGTFVGNNFSYFKKLNSGDMAIASESDLYDNWAGGRNVTLMRLSDVYLMYAEALLEGNGDVTGAIAQINKVRDRWALELLGPDLATGDDYDGIVYTITTLRDHLRDIERPLELALEGHSIRNIDLRRWGTAQERFTKLAAEEYYLSQFTLQSTGEISNFLLTKGTPGGSEFLIDFEYDQAMLNFVPGTDDYLPLPVEEERNNLGF